MRLATPTGQIPDMLIMEVFGLPEDQALAMAEYAAVNAKEKAPKLSGASSLKIEAVHGDGYFGLRWYDEYLWFQEAGTRAFTMHHLAGKTVPMWINDPSGEERAKNPKAKTRTTADGRVQVLIFRRAARHGERKDVVRRRGGVEFRVSVPRSYPGAPGRINRREQPKPYTRPGKVGGQIAVGNVGVRWRHPGLSGRGFLAQAMKEATEVWQIPAAPIFAAISGES